MKMDLSSHERKELKKKQKDKHGTERDKHKTHLKKNLVLWLIGTLIALGLGYSLIKLGSSISPAYTSSAVHWHADVELLLCGKKVDLPRVPATLGHLGTQLLHTHDDNKIHIEGQIFKTEDISFGKFLEAVGVDVSQEHIMNYRNGDKCGEQEGKLTVQNNNVEIPDFLNYIIKNGDVIRIKFE